MGCSCARGWESDAESWPHVNQPGSSMASRLTWRIWDILSQVLGPGIRAKLGELCSICEKKCLVFVVLSTGGSSQRKELWAGPAVEDPLPARNRKRGWGWGVVNRPKSATRSSAPSVLGVSLPREIVGVQPSGRNSSASLGASIKEGGRGIQMAASGQDAPPGMQRAVGCTVTRLPRTRRSHWSLLSWAWGRTQSGHKWEAGS